MAKVNETFLNALPKQDHIYYKTYFRIEAGYIWGQGMSLENTLRFYEEIKHLFSNTGWTIEEPRSFNSCPTVHKNGNSLYCHPMELTGPCEKALHPEVTQILENAQTCFLRSVDTYSQVYDVTDDQYRTAMDAARREIEEELLQAFTTDQKNKYIPGYYSVIDDVSEHYRVPTLERCSGVICSDDVHIRYVTDVFKNLVEKGKILYIETERGGKKYRSATGPERLETARRQAANLNSKIQAAQERIPNTTDQNTDGKVNSDKNITF